MTKAKRRWLVAACALCVVLLSYFVLYPYAIGREAARKADALLDRFQEAKVTFLRLDREMITPASGKANPRLLKGIWPVVGEKTMIPEVLQEFRTVLTSPWSYSDSTFVCFEPGMALVLEDKGRRLEVVICLACARVRIWENGEEQIGRWYLSRRGTEHLYGLYTNVTGQP